MKSKIKGYGVEEKFLKDGTSIFYPVVVVEETTGFFNRLKIEIKYTFHSGRPACQWYEIPGLAEGFTKKPEAEEFLRKYLNPVKSPAPVFHPYSSCDEYPAGEGPCNNNK